MTPTLARAEIDALVRGMHPDPFAVLGPHDTPGGLVIRVFRPNVRGVELHEFGDPDATPLHRIHADGLFELVVPAATRAAVRLPRAAAVAGRRRRARSTIPIATVRCSPTSTSTCSVRARTSRCSTSSARTPSRTASAPACTLRCGRRMRGASAWSATSMRGTAGSTRCGRSGPGGYWEIFIPDLGQGDPYKFEVIGADGCPRAQGRPVRPLLRGAAADRVDRVGRHRPRVAGRGVDGGARPGATSGSARRCRSTKCISAAGSGRRTGACCPIASWPAQLVPYVQGHGLHARRAAAGDGASLHRFVGLPGDRLLRADQPLRHPGRFQVPGRRVSPGRASA